MATFNVILVCSITCFIQVDKVPVDTCSGKVGNANGEKVGVYRSVDTIQHRNEENSHEEMEFMMA